MSNVNFLKKPYIFDIWVLFVKNLDCKIMKKEIYEKNYQALVN